MLMQLNVYVFVCILCSGVFIAVVIHVIQSCVFVAAFFGCLKYIFLSKYYLPVALFRATINCEILVIT